MAASGSQDLNLFADLTRSASLSSDCVEQVSNELRSNSPSPVSVSSPDFTLPLYLPAVRRLSPRRRAQSLSGPSFLRPWQEIHELDNLQACARSSNALERQQSFARLLAEPYVLCDETVHVVRKCEDIFARHDPLYVIVDAVSFVLPAMPETRCQELADFMRTLPGKVGTTVTSCREQARAIFMYDSASISEGVREFKRANSLDQTIAIRKISRPSHVRRVAELAAAFAEIGSRHAGTCVQIILALGLGSDIVETSRESMLRETVRSLVDVYFDRYGSGVTRFAHLTTIEQLGEMLDVAACQQAQLSAQAGKS